MKTEELKEIRNWFKTYARTFFRDNGDIHALLQLKLEHSKRVANNARSLAQDLGWSSSDINAAEALGLLHDTGRFSQLTEFGTFCDAKSVNHGERGWNIIRQSNILSSLKECSQERILDGVHYHNSRTIPKHLDKESLSSVKLIRDADKLDIFRVIYNAVKQDGFQELPEMLPQITLDGPINPKIIQEFQSCRSCSTGDIKSLADVMLMQLSWIYDINYVFTFQQIDERNIIPNIVDELPRNNEEVNSIVEAIKRFAADNI